MLLLPVNANRQTIPVGNKSHSANWRSEGIEIVKVPKDTDDFIEHICPTLHRSIKVYRNRRDQQCPTRNHQGNDPADICSKRDACGLWIRTQSVALYT